MSESTRITWCREGVQKPASAAHPLKATASALIAVTCRTSARVVGINRGVRMFDLQKKWTSVVAVLPKHTGHQTAQ